MKGQVLIDSLSKNILNSTFCAVNTSFLRNSNMADTASKRLKHLHFPYKAPILYENEKTMGNFYEL